MTLRGKIKFRFLTAHLQDMPNHFLEYQLSIPENVDAIQVKTLQKKKNVIFRPSLIPWDKMKTSKPYCTSTRHT